MEPVAIVGLCIGTLIVGFLLGMAMAKSGVSKKDIEVEEAKTELKQYREDVTAHFGKTAAHFQTLGQNYRELYDHMAAGADNLLEPGEASSAMAFAPMEQLLAANEASDEKNTTDAVVDEANNVAGEPAESQAELAAEIAAKTEVETPVDYEKSDAFAEIRIEDAVDPVDTKMTDAAEVTSNLNGRRDNADA